MGVWGGRWGDSWRSETRESGASLTNAPYGTYVTEAAEAAPPFTFHDIGFASTCGSLCCRSAIFRAATLTSA
jgi:hypothetical protein